MYIDEAPLFDDEQPEFAKGASRWTGNFTDLEDVCPCEAWMEVGQDPTCGAQQRGGTFWKKIYNYFHEHKHLGGTPFLSDRSEASLTKRWTWIQEQTNKFNAAYENMKKRKVAALGIADLMTQSLGQFKVANEQNNFNLVHCLTALKDCPK
ncbi:uncharacterized protein [Lolium perenne]|uniref:uncharacterized protein n=1 Tax=Lolium perenne TaxID=4522 RepID=UPI003A9A0FFB